jgi:hypothetical protein
MRMVRIQIDNTVWCFKRSHTCKKRLKILKGYSEAVMRRKAENEIDKRKRRKGPKKNDLQKITYKTKERTT